jgi:ATP-dependent helicase/DNAse subunit B
LSQILICSGISWAALHEALPSWLPDDSANTLILTPQQWKTQLRFLNSAALSTVEWLERYLESKSNQKRLLSKSAITHLLNAIIYESTGETQTVAARFLNIETSYPGYVRALTEFIIDFRENGGDSLLAALSERKAGPLSGRERDLIDIHDELENVLQQRNLYDLRRAITAFLQDENYNFPSAPKKSTLLVFGFHHLAALETKLLNGLLGRFERTVLAVCRNAAAAETVFRSQISLENFIAQIKQQNTHEVKEIEIVRGQTTFPQQLAESIFHDDKSARLLQPQREIQIIEANNRFAEITNLARQIRRLHEAGVSYERMRLIFPSHEIYASLLLEIFPAYEIPCRLGPGTPLAFYPLAQLVLNMINHAIAPSPFALREMIFSSPYITYSCEVNNAELGEFCNNLEAGLLPDEKAMAALLPAPQTFALDFALIQKLRRRASQAVRSSEALHPLRLIARYLEARHHDNPVERQRAVFNIAAQYFVLARAEKALYVWRSTMAPAEFAQAVEKLLARFNLEENLVASSLPEIIQQDRRVLAHLRQILARLQEQFTTLGGQFEKKFPLVDLIQAFAAMMRDAEHYLPDERMDGVFVCTPQEAPFGSWEATFLGGLIDGDFPAQQPFNFLQPKSEGRGLTGDIAPVDRDRQALYQILASTSRHVFLSYPISAGNKKLLVSPFVTEIRKCFAAEIPTENETAPRLYTAREKLAFMRGDESGHGAVQPERLAREGVGERAGKS